MVDFEVFVAGDLCSGIYRNMYAGCYFVYTGKWCRSGSAFDNVCGDGLYQKKFFDMQSVEAVMYCGSAAGFAFSSVGDDSDGIINENFRNQRIYNPVCGSGDLNI